MSKYYKFTRTSSSDKQPPTALFAMISKPSALDYIEESEKYIIQLYGKHEEFRNRSDFMGKLERLIPYGPFIINLVSNNEKELQKLVNYQTNYQQTNLEFADIGVKTDIPNYEAIVNNLIKYANYSDNFFKFIQNRISNLTAIPAQYILNCPEKSPLLSSLLEKKILINPEPKEFNIYNNQNTYLASLMEAYGIASNPTQSSIIDKAHLQPLLSKASNYESAYIQIINAFALHPNFFDKWFDFIGFKTHLSNFHFSLLMLNDNWIIKIFEGSKELKGQIIFYYLHNDGGYKTIFDYFTKAKKALTNDKKEISTTYYVGVAYFRKYALEALSEFSDIITTEYLMDVIEFLDEEYRHVNSASKSI
ncbi:hypothetical protein TVAGG3_0720970 [Trichomonas vaginalis G3]|uniref:hypothetical protein n=1 Tax=Trichomonas vaginalis (strain ATCC PRA-98 / G3) TaxID=412133 RepID=UPI0021E5B78D|nr:hypothetical protein TVAGG3_0720970 [Trichomonas vaginalis G3]KAI5510583.1 hypothetical protein TVAGG3_0720970 [Trichomonas vaginalis G3]